MSAPDELIGLAVGTLGLLRSMGGACGVAIYSAIFQAKATTIIPERVSEAVLSAGLPQTSLPKFLEVLTGVVTDKSLQTIPGVTAQIIEAGTLALHNAYLSSFRYVWYTCTAFGVVALICSFFIKDVSLATHIQNFSYIVFTNPTWQLSNQLTSKVAQHLIQNENLSIPESQRLEEAYLSDIQGAKEEIGPSFEQKEKTTGLQAVR